MRKNKKLRAELSCYDDIRDLARDLISLESNMFKKSFDYSVVFHPVQEESIKISFIKSIRNISKVA